MEADEAELRALYAASYARLVAAVLLAGAPTRSDAEDAVQEAFVRLVPRWPKVREYDSPESWLRRVALNVASNRRRKLRNALLAATRHAPAQVAADPGEPALEVRQALVELPKDQRRVLVLHHCLDLSVEQVAAELGVPLGTVKSRLARGRAALAARLRLDEETEVAHG